MDTSASAPPTGPARQHVDDEHFLRVSDLVKSFGDARALDGVSFSIPKGSFLVLLGPSGCGKTTTMRSIVGLEQPDSGTIALGYRVLFDRVTNVPVHKRGMGMVFQSYAIWPHRTVAQNIAFPLKVQKRPRAEIKRRVDEVLELVGLGHVGARSASALSGGQMQRVALARSIVMRPELLLLDEPLSNLDAQLRDRLRVELKRLQQDIGITSVYVTHDQGEALSMADTVAVMFDGVIHQFASPQEIYERPASLKVASFVGKSNFFRGTAHPENGGTRLRLDGGGTALVSADGWSGSGPAVGRVRIEDIQVAERATGGCNELAGRVTVTTYQGSQVGYLVETLAGPSVEALCVPDGRIHAKGDEVYLRFPAESLRLYEADEQAVLPEEEQVA